jgi:hypothetical protein
MFAQFVNPKIIVRVLLPFAVVVAAIVWAVLLVVK